MTSPHNRTITLTKEERLLYESKLITPTSTLGINECLNKTFFGSSLDILSLLPTNFIDLVIVDPPYNMTKLYSSTKFSQQNDEEHVTWFNDWFQLLLPKLKETATVYVCSEWRTSALIYPILQQHINIVNRITWEREKGRGASKNWKNASEDIWFCTKSNNYVFNVDAVKTKKKVIAPYKDNSGNPKDWKTENNENYRLTFPSNIWTDITVPFWSMPENTEHPTQKPEKLIAKLMLASSNQNDIVLDPFLGSGTTSVVAKKLSRQYIGIEREKEYCLLAEKRLALAEQNKSIQGYETGVFLDRNFAISNKQEQHINSSLFTEVFTYE
jgi:site-specific DNA-methyltransferase (adenine-specific)